MDNNSKTTMLAGHAADLATSLYDLQEHCGHENTSNDISHIAGELTLLSTTLWRLHEAISGGKEQYTVSFQQDLEEITRELELLFDEIAECCEEMQKADGNNITAVGWFFKKGRVTKLHKHLEALKTTLIVMRTVLHHGKEYGIQNSPGRLAESSPHTMNEDRAILESVFAKNRHAIIDLHNLEGSRLHKHSPSSSSFAEPELNPGAHGRNLSAATGVDVPPIPDVLPSSNPRRSGQPSKLNRRFSKRGVRLGVHMSILDLGAHEAPMSLRKKWIEEARSHGYDRLEPTSNLTKISEYEDDEVVTLKEALDESRRDFEAEELDNAMKENNGVRRSNSHALKESSAGQALRKAIHLLSLSGLKEHKADKKGSKTGLKERSVVNMTKPELKTPDFDKEFENGATI